MFTRPADLSDDVVAAVLHEAWQLRIRRIDHAPVGFGSYHWHAWANEVVDRHAARLVDTFSRYDRLAGAAADQPELMVLTHGEPHAANTINTDGGLVLVDWDTALVAPRERDLWSLALEAPAILHHYATKTGVTPLPYLLELYRLRWDLTEVSLYVSLFRARHDDTADTRVAWDGLRHSLQALSA